MQDVQGLGSRARAQRAGVTLAIRVLNWHDGARPSTERRWFYVGRPSRYGNPYPATPKRTRHHAVFAFRMYAEKRLRREPHWLNELLEAEALICFCAPLECHAEVLVELIAARRRALRLTA